MPPGTPAKPRRCANGLNASFAGVKFDLRPRKLDWYIGLRFLRTFLFSVLLVVVVIVVIDLSEKIGNIVENHTPIRGLIFDYYLNFIPWVINVASPIFIFLSVILFTSSLTQKSEVIAILSSGISFYRFLRPYLVVAGGLSVVFFLLNGYVVPEGTRTWEAFEKTYIRPEGIHADRNMHRKIADSTFFYLYSFNQYTAEGVQFVLEEESGGRIDRIVRASTGKYIDSTDRWLLRNIVERILRPDGTEYVYARNDLDTALLITPEDIHRRPNQLDALTNTELEAQIALERRRGSELVTALTAERYERQAYPFTTLILTTIAVAVSSRKRRGGIGLQLGLGLLLSFAFILLTFSIRLIVGEALPAGLALWLPNLVFAALAVFLVRIAPK